MFYPSRLPDPGVLKAPNPNPQHRYLLKALLKNVKMEKKILNSAEIGRYRTGTGRWVGSVPRYLVNQRPAQSRETCNLDRRGQELWMWFRKPHHPNSVVLIVCSCSRQTWRTAWGCVRWNRCSSPGRRCSAWGRSRYPPPSPPNPITGQRHEIYLGAGCRIWFFLFAGLGGFRRLSFFAFG